MKAASTTPTTAAAAAPEASNDEQHPPLLHQRNDSIYSMDSFVADYSSQGDEGSESHGNTSSDKMMMPPPVPELQLPQHQLHHQLPQPYSPLHLQLPQHQQQQQRPPTYISPSSSAATTPLSHATPRRAQDTIDFSAARSSQNAEHTPRQAPPNPFFSPSYYQDDPEVSDGSFILHDTPGTPLVRQSQGQQPLLPYGNSPAFLAKADPKRDRFPSFDDSVASAGSIHYVVPSIPSSHNHKPKARPPAAPSTASTPLTAQQIQQLPYHERRKLLAQRRQEPPAAAPQAAVYGRGMPPMQQQLQAPRSDRNGMPLQPPHAPLPLPQQQQQQQHSQQQHQQQQPIYPPYLMPPPEHMFYGGGGGGSPVMMQHHQHHPLQQQQHQQSPYHGRPLYPGVPPPPVGYGNYPMPPQPAMGYYPMPPGYPVPPPHMMQQQQQQHPHHPQQQQLQQQQAYLASPRATDRLQTTGLPRGYTGLPSRPNTSGSQSTIGRTRSSSLDSSDGTDKAPPPGQPPPPPPPPTPPPRHARADSVGSMSSLGSLERSGREEERDKKRKQKTNFLARLNPWAVKEPTVDDYHRKNQAFLRKASQERSRNSPSPKQEFRRVPLGSMDRPPPSRGTHKRLPSIDNDDWEEDGTGKKTTALKADALQPARLVRTYSSGEDSGYGEDPSHLQSRVPPRFKNKQDSDADERTRLLPPPGISSNEQSDIMYTGQTPDRGSSRLRQGQNPDVYGSVATVRAGNTTASLGYDYEQAKKSRRKKKKARQRSKKSRQDQQSDGSSDASHSSSSASSQDYHVWMKKRSRVLDKERTKLIKKWRSEARKEEEVERREQENKLWHRRLYVYMEEEFGQILKAAFKFLTWFEAFIANIPLTINAIALAVANLGVVWFKFAEENMESCEPVHYHSSQCSFPEFPGCFYCDKEARMYKVAVNFHWGCSAVAGILASLFICKLLVAPRVVFDELGSPTTAAPAGLFCMTLDIVFAGRGMVGQTLVSAASFMHLCLAVWFIYMALAYHIMPEPSWFPNTSSIGISAVKTWLYYPMAGHFLMAISLSLNFFFFPISLIRVAVNRKISATVGWMQMSAPNVSLYALTLMAQPSFEEEHPDITKFQVVHRLVYLPCMHILFALCILGMCASCHSLIVRWKDFRKLPFSPAHAAFCVPTLSHANAVQAYRASINSFSDMPSGSPFKVFLYAYWVTILIGGTVVTVAIGIMFLLRLPEWTHIDTEGEIEPPAPYETAMTSSNLISTGETLVQSFVSPAILQANETGTLVLARNQAGVQVYRRTRKVTAFGFEPIMSELQMDIERDLLLEWVARNPPRRRHRTLSVPGIDFSYGENIGTGNSGVYGGMDHPGPLSPWSRRQRANTSSPYTLSGRKNFTQPRYR